MSIKAVAGEFFEACEAGKGWAACGAFCTPYATFSSQAAPLAEIVTLEQYTDWMQGLMTTLTDGRYEVKFFATDEERQGVCIYAIFTGTHLAGGPVEPTGKTTRSDYVYVMQFDDNKIAHLTKIWNSAYAMRELGWS
jgi:ketosteroid isomerase-like protein